MKETITALIVSLAIGLGAYFLGWVIARNDFATECERLSRFYVGTQVYECKPAGGIDRPTAKSKVVL